MTEEGRQETEDGRRKTGYLSFGVLEGTENSRGVAVEQFLDGFRLLLKMGSWRVLEIDSEDEVITCFLQRGFRDIQETNFFRRAFAPESLSDIGRHGHCRPANLTSQAESFFRWKLPCYRVNAKHKIVRLLPYDKFTKIFRRRSMYCH